MVVAATVDVVVRNGGELFLGDDGVVVGVGVSAVVGAVAVVVVMVVEVVVVVLEIC